MNTNHEVINIIKRLSLNDRLMIVEEILRSIHEEEVLLKEDLKIKKAEESGPAILTMAGILGEEEAKLFESAIAESRKIDEDEW